MNVCVVFPRVRFPEDVVVCFPNWRMLSLHGGLCIFDSGPFLANPSPAGQTLWAIYWRPSPFSHAQSVGDCDGLAGRGCCRPRDGQNHLQVREASILACCSANRRDSRKSNSRPRQRCSHASEAGTGDRQMIAPFRAWPTRASHNLQSRRSKEGSDCMTEIEVSAVVRICSRSRLDLEAADEPGVWVHSSQLLRAEAPKGKSRPTPRRNNNHL